jgi:hypothetical protein
MEKTTVRLGIFLLACALVGLVVGCSRKAAYSDMNVNASRPNRDTQASEEQPVDAAAPGADPAGGSPAPPPPPQQPTQPAPFKLPAFLDAQKGEVKDLPSYPAGQRMSIQYGPLPGGEMASIVLQVSAPMDGIAAFYDKAIKSNGWEVTVRNRDPEYSEWRVKKRGSEEGGVNDGCRASGHGRPMS